MRNMIITLQKVIGVNMNKRLGVLIDLSRGKVWKIEQLKKYIKIMKEFRYTYVVLYMEDLIELKEYPEYGFLRGKYSTNELKELVKFCGEINIEIYPAVQLLGHMEHFLHWEAHPELIDTRQVINVTNSETYQFIECVVEQLSDIFNSDKINIGLDEAFDLGMGNVYRTHGTFNQKELFLNHLNKVNIICLEKGFSTVQMWSDMLFSIYTGQGEEGLYSQKFKEKVEQLDDNIELVYWNYWERDTKVYEQTIEMHKQFSKNIVLGLGIHTWGLSHYNLNQLDVTKAAVLAGEKCGINDVMFTMWGDDGSIYDIESTYIGLFESAKCYYPLETKQFEEITNIEYSEAEVISTIFDIGINPLKIVWNDPITNIYMKSQKSSYLKKVKEKAVARKIECGSDKSKVYNLYLDIVANEIEMFITKDNQLKEKLITELMKYYEELLYELELRWRKEAKLHGIEELQNRLSGKVYRFKFLKKNLNSSEIIEICNETCDIINAEVDSYNKIAKATKFRW